MGLAFDTILTDPRHLRADLRLIRTAIRQGWPIPVESRVILMDRVNALLENPEAIPEGIRERVTLAAAWLTLEATRENSRAVLEAMDIPLGGLRIHRTRRPA